ncbi:hypothetical protein DFH27DRAFT_525272 [Peziza echinospora]|nr:hypothetical protein DFH27DRAFT_525272 [Peziza echinospora]
MFFMENVKNHYFHAQPLNQLIASLSSSLNGVRQNKLPHSTTLISGTMSTGQDNGPDSGHGRNSSFSREEEQAIFQPLISLGPGALRRSLKINVDLWNASLVSMSEVERGAMRRWILKDIKDLEDSKGHRPYPRLRILLIAAGIFIFYGGVTSLRAGLSTQFSGFRELGLLLQLTALPMLLFHTCYVEWQMLCSRRISRTLSTIKTAVGSDKLDKLVDSTLVDRLMGWSLKNSIPARRADKTRLDKTSLVRRLQHFLVPPQAAHSWVSCVLTTSFPFHHSPQTRMQYLPEVQARLHRTRRTNRIYSQLQYVDGSHLQTLARDYQTLNPTMDYKQQLPYTYKLRMEKDIPQEARKESTMLRLPPNNVHTLPFGTGALTSYQ